MGYRVLRVWNRAVMQDLPDVLARIHAACVARALPAED
jgi:very-short-patch-repair endonuclease